MFANLSGRTFLVLPEALFNLKKFGSSDESQEIA